MSYPLYEDVKALQRLEERLRKDKDGRHIRHEQEQAKDSRV